MESSGNALDFISTISEREDSLMESPPQKTGIKAHFLKVRSFLFSTKGKIGMLVLLSFLAFGALLSFTAVTVHSESELKTYRQVRFLKDTIIQQKNSEIVQIESTGRYFTQPVSINYEVDKITPTPTPQYNPAEDDVWIKLAHCESKQNWSIDTGNGYYGGLQFNLGAWASVGGSGKPSEASKDEQIMRGKMLQAKRGWGPWGACSKKLGLL